MIKTLKNIVWKDIFKPRYLVITQVTGFPIYEKENVVVRHYPCIMQRPYKRPLTMKFNTFYNLYNSLDTMIFCGSYKTMKNIYGIGSLNSDNLNNPIIAENK